MTGDNLRRLLAPLGVYDLDARSVSGAMIDALGDALDPVRQIVSEALRDAFIQTTGEEALAQWERMLPPHGAGAPAQRREAAACMLGQGDVWCSKDRIENALEMCGVEATLTVSGGAVTVRAARTPEAEALVRRLIPAHLSVSWAEP